jgi:hypothetical protein
MNKTVFFILYFTLSVIAIAMADDYVAKIPTTSNVWYYRSPMITALNPYGELPSVEFITDKIVLTPEGDNWSKFVRRVKLAFDTPDKKYPLYNPENGQIIGSFSPMEYYAIQYSAWRAAELYYTTNGAEATAP